MHAKDTIPYELQCHTSGCGWKKKVTNKQRKNMIRRLALRQMLPTQKKAWFRCPRCKKKDVSWSRV
jgi:DNA-directed RNA polymerase subunit M/transcription elongation factor TFIIS